MKQLSNALLSAISALVCLSCASDPPARPEAKTEFSVEEPLPSQTKIFEMNQVDVAARYFAAKFGKEGVLVVYDIDNTLLASETLLGSDQWYVWQRSELELNDPRRIWKDKDSACLLEAQELLYNTRSMRITHPSEISAISNLRRDGFTQWVLTSRGKDFWAVTFRELKRQDLRFSPFSPDLEFTWKEFAYEQAKLDEYFTAQEQKDRYLSRQVRVDSGVYMTAGMHKGSALLLLLDRLGLKETIKAVVFVDDTETHIKGMDPELKRFGIDARSYWYGAEDKEVDKLKVEEGRAEVTREWCDLWRHVQAIEASFRPSVMDLRRKFNEKVEPLSQCAIDLEICKTK
jgi:hypothetical protein